MRCFRLRQLCCALLCAALAGGCADAFGSRASYVESVVGGDLGVTRDYAMRISFWEFDYRGGGYIEFFEIDGLINTPDLPYFRPTHCAYFGEDAVIDQQFRLETTGVDGECLFMNLDLSGSRRNVVARIEPAGANIGLSPEAPVLELTFESERVGNMPPQCGGAIIEPAPGWQSRCGEGSP